MTDEFEFPMPDETEHRFDLVQAINAVFREALTESDEASLLLVCVNIAAHLLGSEISLLIEFGGNPDQVTKLVSNNHLLNASYHNPHYAARGSSTIRDLAEGLRLRARDLALTTSEGESRGEPLPDGWPSEIAVLRNFLLIPFEKGLKPDGMLALANRRGGYSPADRASGEALAAAIQQALRSKRADIACRASEERLQVLTSGMAQLVWRAAAPRAWAWSGPQWTEFTGLSQDESRDEGWLNAIHPDDRQAVLAAWDAAGTDGMYQVDHRIRHQASGRYRWFTSRGMPLRTAGGGISEWLGTSTDIDDLKRLQEHERILLTELQHRVRNTLGIIRSIVRRTIAASDDIEEMERHLDGRIGAFARAQTAISRTGGAQGISLQQIIEDELDVFRIREGETTNVQGPQTSLKPKPAEILSLAIHELATNSIKYGALSPTGGQLEVTWKRYVADGAEWLWLLWSETVEAHERHQSHRGFGTELFEEWIPYELDAYVKFSPAPCGTSLELRFPLVGMLAD